MTTPRRPNRRSRPKQGMYVEIDPELKANLDDWASRSGRPLWWVVNEVTRLAGQLVDTETGLPIDWESSEPQPALVHGRPGAYAEGGGLARSA